MLPRSSSLRWRTAPLLALLIGLWSGVGRAPTVAAPAAQPPKALRLYVFDCGVLNISKAGVERYHVTTAEVGETRMPVPCFLIAHPKGTLMWDVGVIPDRLVEAQAQHGARSDINPTAAAVVTRTLESQLAQIGYNPADITYVAISHAHRDHTANLDEFASSTWLARPAERDFMWKENNERVDPSFYTKLRDSRSIALEADELDVFGDGQVVMKSAPGHTPGHQVLVLRLPKTGRLMLGGDLYHYPLERALHRAPPDNEFDVRQSAASRAAIEEYLKQTKTTLWIEHDFGANAKLKKAPAYYE
jgi:glyoxylase-like metal-dependent hydrolase (beta-lactamase superfamily II)